MSQQDVLLSVLRKKIKGQSLIEAVALALNISYDAAHRRVSSKSKFSIDEAVILCRHYKISIDAILTGNNVVVLEKTQEITSAHDMQAYFEQSAHYLDGFAQKENVALYYAAKDIPLFYTIGGTLLSKFKLFVWMELLAGNGSKPFEDFSFAPNVQQFVERIKAVYDKAQVHEIWNDTTINSTLQQIFYFFESGLLSQANASLLYDDLETLLANVEQKSAEAGSNFHLYYNELLILNNNVIVSAPEKTTMFIPYTALGYFITEDETTCQKAGEYFQRQMKASKSLNLSGTRDRKVFFNKAMRKIEFYRQKLSSPDELLL